MDDEQVWGEVKGHGWMPIERVYSVEVLDMGYLARVVMNAHERIVAYYLYDDGAPVVIREAA